MQTIDLILTSRHDKRRFEADATFIKNGSKKPIIIFNHGFKGFKDWGPFHLVAATFAQYGFVFIKMNFSHNGVTPENRTEFVDLEAFAKNNFCIELDDTGVLIDYLFSYECAVPRQEIDLNQLFILGHSRGGASAILKAGEDERIKAVATWAAVNNLESWHSREELDYWKENGRIYIHNSRTNQQMPLDYQLVDNFIENRDRLQVPETVKSLKTPMISIHGSQDPTVLVDAVEQIKAWNSNVEIKIIEGANHTFGGGHPFDSKQLPPDLKHIIGITADFFTSIIRQ